MSADFAATLMGRGFASGLPCQAPSEGAPQSVARGAREVGIGQRLGCFDRPQYCWGAGIPLRGRIFLQKRLLRPTRCAPERSPRGPAKRGSGSGGDAETAPEHCRGANSPLRGRIFLRKRLLRPSRSIPVVAFRASHPAKPPSRQRRFVQLFPNALPNSTEWRTLSGQLRPSNSTWTGC
jgi:hypothetical protein